MQLNFNYRIQRIFEMGITIYNQRRVTLKTKTFSLETRMKFRFSRIDIDSKNNIDQISNLKLDNLYSVFMIWIVGLIISLFGFCLEFTYLYCKVTRMQT